MVATLTAAALSCPALADADERTFIAYGVAGAEIATAGTILLHVYTDSSPSGGIGLAVNMLPLVGGIGAGAIGSSVDADPRPALGLHGAVIGALPLLAIGASVEGRGEDDGVKLGPATLTLGMLGAAGGAYLAAWRVDDTNESVAVATAPLVGALAGGLTGAIVHFLDDGGPSSTGRLLRFAGSGMLLGTIGSMIYAWPDRDESQTSMRIAPSFGSNTTIPSYGAAF